ncbi:SMP-30/gluconolactonase/LRE family protein [Actinoplanes sp. CA-030573]|uniref:SMP-30/gluconolactonase/LRE family protein n=1 Tax=Actinoplanes sp. CA-030573 TaxID=3239898 RepID=UPI003D94A27E
MARKLITSPSRREHRPDRALPPCWQRQTRACPVGWSEGRTMRSRSIQRGALLLTAPVLALTVATASSATTPAAPAPRFEVTAARASCSSTIVVPGETAFPESIDYDIRGGFYYVSGNQNAIIYRGRPNQSTAQVFLTAADGVPNNPTGIKAANGRLYIAGAFEGTITVFDLTTHRLIRRFTTGAGGLINDLVVTGRGDVYATDSFRPTLWHITAAQVRHDPPLVLSPWVDLSPSVPYGLPDRPAANGIVALNNGRTLVFVQNTTGVLYRVDTSTGAITTVDTGGVTLRNADGLTLTGHTLYVVRNVDEQIAVLHLSLDARRARVATTITDPSFDVPTSVAVTGFRLLVTNSQLDKVLAGKPGVPPFTISSIPRPRHRH